MSQEATASVGRPSKSLKSSASSGRLFASFAVMVEDRGIVSRGARKMERELR